MSGRPARKPWGARDFRALQEENARARRSDALAAALLGEDARTRGRVAIRRQRILLNGSLKLRSAISNVVHSMASRRARKDKAKADRLVEALTGESESTYTLRKKLERIWTDPRYGISKANLSVLRPTRYARMRSRKL